MSPRTRDLSRRERQIMDILYRLGQATIAEIQEELIDPPTDSAIRATLRILAARGWVDRETADRRNVYRPAVSKADAGRSAVRSLLRTFFHDSSADAVAAILEADDADLDDQDLDRLQRLIDRAREGREEGS